MIPSIDLKKLEDITAQAEGGNVKSAWAQRNNIALINDDYVDKKDRGVVIRRGPRLGIWIWSNNNVSGGDWICGGVPLDISSVPQDGSKIIILKEALGVPDDIIGSIEALKLVYSLDKIEVTDSTKGTAGWVLEGRGYVWEIVDKTFCYEIIAGGNKIGNKLNKVDVPDDFQCSRCGTKLTYFRFAEYCPNCDMIKNDAGKWVARF